MAKQRLHTTNRRPPKMEVPYQLAKTLWGKVWEKFEEEEAAKIKLIKHVEKLNLLQQKTGVGASVLTKLKKAVELTFIPDPPVIKMSRETINGLCNYLPDDALRQCILEPEAFALYKYLGKYELYWRDRKDGVATILQSELKLDAGGVTLSGEAGSATGGRIMLKNANLFFTVENENKNSNFIFNVGTVGTEHLSYIPGLCQTLNADVRPVNMAVVLFRKSETDQEPDRALLERYFDKFRGREFVPGVKLSWFNLTQPPYRISGLFGNWYIYHAYKDIIRRGKISIDGERRITYVGTIHKFNQGHIEIFNNTNISITLCNDSKILHLLGRIGDQSDLSSRTRIRCIFSSTGKGGSTLKAGVSLMIRETEITFDEMSPAYIVSEENSRYLSDEDLKLILNAPEDIEI